MGIQASGAVFRVGKVEDCPPLWGVFLRDSPNRVNLKVRERGGGVGGWKCGLVKVLSTYFNMFSLPEGKLENSCGTRGPE